MTALSIIDYIALFNMLFFWLLYDKYSDYHATFKKHSLVSIIDNLRSHWTHNLMLTPREDRIPDGQLVGILHRGISFFISITIFIIAGLLATLTTNEAMLSLLAHIPYSADNVAYTWNIKIIFMIIIFVEAFFRLTWALRQNQYYAIAIFAAPHNKVMDKDHYKLVKKLAALMSISGKNFNNALRSYYFGLSIITWLVHPILFIISTILVVWIIYRREFHSNTLSMLTEINYGYDKEKSKHFFK